MADSASLLNVLASGSAPEVSEVPFLRSGMRESTVKDARARFYDLGRTPKATSKHGGVPLRPVMTRPLANMSAMSCWR